MNYIQKYWRPMSAIIFLFIVIVDLVIMPALFLNFEEHRDFSAVYAEAQKFKDPQVQIAIIKQVEIKPWKPLTLQGGGMFYICFGGILGAASFTRGKEKVARIEHGHDDAANF